MLLTDHSTKENHQVRIQAHRGNVPKSMIETLVCVFKNNGFFGLYSGPSASLLRQIPYSTTRLGIYEELKQDFAAQSLLALLPDPYRHGIRLWFLGRSCRKSCRRPQCSYAARFCVAEGGEEGLQKCSRWIDTIDTDD